MRIYFDQNELDNLSDVVSVLLTYDISFDVYDGALSIRLTSTDQARVVLDVAKRSEQ